MRTILAWQALLNKIWQQNFSRPICEKMMWNKNLLILQEVIRNNNLHLMIQNDNLQKMI